MDQNESQTITRERRHHIGMRVIKTVVAVILCGLFAYVRDKSAFYSMISVLACIQNSSDKTIESSINRALGTLVGGVAGVLTVYSMDTLGILHIDLLRYALLALLLIPIIELCLVMKRPDTVGMACMVFMCLVVDPGDKPAIYSIERLFETVVGVVMACGIDVLLPYQPVPQGAPESAPKEERGVPEPQAAQKPRKSKNASKKRKRSGKKSAGAKKSGRKRT